MTQAIRVINDDETGIAEVVVQTLTRAKQYIGKFEAEFLVCRGDVEVDGVAIKKLTEKVSLGNHGIRIGPSTFQINVEASLTE